jgi:hypothetical protein
VRIAQLAVIVAVVVSACGGEATDDRPKADAGSACARFATPGEACREEPACRWIVTACRESLGHGYYDSALKCSRDSDCAATHAKCLRVNVRDCRDDWCIEAKPTIDVCWPPPETPLPDPPAW